jgi:flavin-dependent dehydrogenase
LIRADVLILGAGPAGAVAALNLAPTRRVVLVERREQPALRIGESLPPAARRLLSDMDLFDEFVAQRYTPSYGNRSIWGQTAPLEIDFLRDPDGHGWHLDRARFDMWLREMAVARGAILLTPAWLLAVERDKDWQVRIATSRGEQTVWAAFALDAGGRAAPLGRRIGARRRMDDRLVCRWVHGSGRPIGRGAGLTVVEAVQEGWWYTAPVPDGRRVLAFFTDIDLMPTRIGHDVSYLVDFAAATREVASILAEAEFRPISCGFTAAHSAVLEPCGGAGWLAAGDATMSFDPLSSQGLVHALFTGLAAAEAAHSCLVGDDDAVPRYLLMMNSVQRNYRRHRDFYYAGETRWPSAPFWQRRQNSKDQSQNNVTIYI